MSHTTNIDTMNNHGRTRIGLQDLGIGSIGINTKVVAGGIHDTKGSVSFLQDLYNYHPTIIGGGAHTSCTNCETRIGGLQDLDFASHNTRTTKNVNGGINSTVGNINFLQDLYDRNSHNTYNTKNVNGGITGTTGNIHFLQDLGEYYPGSWVNDDALLELGAEFPDVHIGTKVITGGIHHTGGDVKFQNLWSLFNHSD